MSVRIPIIVVGGTGSGVGKTSVTLGLIACLKRRGLKVQSFKVGPDYLDPTHLTRASGRQCYNLDGWMTGREYVQKLFFEHAHDADIAVVEGVMGLYDGRDPAGPEGSTAQIACWLGAPVLLVVNAHGAMRSIAATVNGFVNFPDAPVFAGIIANRTGSQKHADGLSASLASVGLPELVGAVPRGGFPELSSRHLGLKTADGDTLSDSMLDGLADACEKYVDIDAILSLTPVLPDPAGKAEAVPVSVRIGLAQDEAFHFYYADSMDLLARAGVEWVPFSPLRDKVLPAGIDGLWLGGGYPEEFADVLSGNGSMLESVRSFAESGRAVYAECGGLMYLCESMVDLNGNERRAAGVLPLKVRMLKHLKRLGYASVIMQESCMWGRKGVELRGHEFHYSELTGTGLPEGWRFAYQVKLRDGTEYGEGLFNGSTMASYVHLHMGSNPDAAGDFVQFVKGRAEI